jgi:4'-phosphopantetheinyl transferase
MLKFENVCNYVDYTELIRVVGQERKKRINNARFDYDKRIILFSELLLRKVISEHLGIDAYSLDIKYSPFGKPCIEKYEYLNFSASHTRSAIVFVLADSRIGIDIESIITDRDISFIANYFTQAEKEQVLENCNSNRKTIEIWTRKEAYLKALGIGLNRPLNTFSVLCNNHFLTFNSGDDVVSIFADNQSCLAEIRKCDITEAEVLEYYK